MRKMAKEKTEKIVAQQIAEGVWGLEVDGTMLDERFKNAKEAVDFGREKYGLTAKARTLPNKKANKKNGTNKRASSKKDSTKYDETVPEKLKPNSVAKVHVDRDLRWPKSIREQLPLEPGDK